MDWANGGKLTQRTAQELRELVYKGNIERLDWDGELLIRGEFAGAGGKLLQQRSFAPTKVLARSVPVSLC